jgi:hypothetical protein
VSTEKPTVEQVAEAWLRYISEPHKYGSLTTQVLINMTGQESAITKIFHDGMRWGYMQRQIDEWCSQRGQPEPPESPELPSDEAMDILTAAGLPLDRAASYVLTAVMDDKDPVAWATHFVKLRKAVKKL